MLLSYLDNWATFIIFFTLFLAVTLVMSKQASNFYTKDVVVKKFSIMELEIPASPDVLDKLIKGLYELPGEDSRKSVMALKSQLWTDFLFMPLAYGSIFLLCRHVSGKMESELGKCLFIEFAYLQLIPWLCDIIENIFLLNKIKEANPNIKHANPVASGNQQAAIKWHRIYLRMEAAKWGISLTALICAISAVCYCWLTGNYSAHSFNYLLIALTEVVVFIVISRLLKNRKTAI